MEFGVIEKRDRHVDMMADKEKLFLTVAQPKRHEKESICHNAIRQYAASCPDKILNKCYHCGGEEL